MPIPDNHNCDDGDDAITDNYSDDNGNIDDEKHLKNSFFSFYQEHSWQQQCG